MMKPGPSFPHDEIPWPKQETKDMPLTTGDLKILANARHAENIRLRMALTRLLDWNLGIKEGRGNHHPQDHIDVIEAALFENAMDELPTVTKEEGMKMRTGQATPGRLVPHHGSGPDNQ